MKNKNLADVKYIPLPNDQKDDPAFTVYLDEKKKIEIRGGSQCQGNSNRSTLNVIGQEFDGKIRRKPDEPDYCKVLQSWTEHDYYSHFAAYLTASFKKEKTRIPNRTDLMVSQNHAWFMTELLDDFGIPVYAKWLRSENYNPELIHNYILETHRPVSIGTRLTDAGHWINIFESDKEKKVFKGNDSWGKHPYNKSQKGGHVSYEWEYLAKHGLVTIIGFFDK